MSALRLVETFDVENLEDTNQLVADIVQRRRWLRDGFDVSGWVCLPPGGSRMIGTWYRPMSYVLHFRGRYRSESQAQAAVEHLLAAVRSIGQPGHVLVLPEGLRVL